MNTPLEPDDFFLLLSTLLSERKAATRAQGRVCFAVEGAGAFVLDLRDPGAVGRSFDDTADTIIVCNRRGLEALTDGTLDATHTDGAGALFLWSGSPGPLSAIARALGGNRSVFDTRIAVMKGVL